MPGGVRGSRSVVLWLPAGHPPGPDPIRQAGVGDTTQFARCLAGPEGAGRVRRDLDFARRLGLTGTPAVVINGELIEGALTEDELVRWVKRALKGKGWDD